MFAFRFGLFLLASLLCLWWIRTITANSETSEKTCKEGNVCEAPSSKPSPIELFSIMRLTHDAIRLFLDDVKKMVESGVSPKEIQKQLVIVGKVIETHAACEDFGMFPLFDELFSEVTLNKGNFREEHKKDFKMFFELIEATKTYNTTSNVRGVFMKWYNHVMEHLLSEESNLSPLISKISVRESKKK